MLNAQQEAHAILNKLGLANTLPLVATLADELTHIVEREVASAANRFEFDVAANARSLFGPVEDCPHKVLWAAISVAKPAEVSSPSSLEHPKRKKKSATT